MSQFEPGEVLKGSIADITAQLADYDDAQLKALHDAESGDGGQKRAGMLSALHAETAARDLDKRTKAAIDAAAKDGVKLFSQADLDAVADDHGKRIAALEEKLKAAEGATPATAVAARPRKLALTGEAGDDAFRLAFTDDTDTTMPDLPELQFGAGDFTIDRATQAIVLKQPIRFPEAVGRSEVRKVWLVDGDGKAAAMAELVNPLPVGGGTAASIPAGFLAFRKPEPAAKGKTKAAA
jgi:hypothetical protein